MPLDGNEVEFEVKIKPEPVRPKLTPVQEALIEASLMLKRDGWTKNSFGGMQGPNCMVGSINRLNLDYFTRMYAFRALARTIRKKGSERGYDASYFSKIDADCCIIFNDNFGTTFYDILDIFDEAIKNS